VGHFEPGDVYITNDPFRGGSHLNDVTVITPVHDHALSRILFFVASRAHHAEIGGTRPGSMPPDSRSLAEEGVLIRAFRWTRDGLPRHDALRALLSAPPYPSRSPDENLADIVAQAAANQTGARELGLLVQRYGINVVHSYMRHIQVAAERKMRATLRKLPKGLHPFEDSLDDGSVIRLAVTIDDDAAQFDFTGTAPVHPGNLNANPAIVTSAILYCLRCLIDDDIPLNAGVLAPVRIILPECLLNPPRHDDPARCPAIVGGNVETSQRIVDCVFGALGTVAAGQGTMNNLLMGNDRFGYYETICGGAGAGKGFHGADAVHTHMTNTRLTDPEVLESRVPVRLVRFQIRRGSGGQGKYRGGDGVVREIEFLEPLQVSILSQRRTTQPYGLNGGGAGAAGQNLLQRFGIVDVISLPSICQFDARPGDRLTIETPGGGGWGRNDE
jgi:5-oxoprolinase (ATP-hydrolysing)